MQCLFEMKMDVRWGDLDAFNHVNNTCYLRFIEEARVCWFKSLTADWASTSLAPVLVSVLNNFKKPIVWPARIQVDLWCEHVGTKSLKLAHRIASAADSDIVYADGHAVLVWVDTLSGQSVALPMDILNALNSNDIHG